MKANVVLSEVGPPHHTASKASRNLFYSLRSLATHVYLLIWPHKVISEKETPSQLRLCGGREARTPASPHHLQHPPLCPRVDQNNQQYTFENGNRFLVYSVQSLVIACTPTEDEPKGTLRPRLHTYSNWGVSWTVMRKCRIRAL